MIKTIIRRWLCEHKREKWISTKQTTIMEGTPDESKLIKALIRGKCKDCGKLTKLKVKI